AIPTVDPSSQPFGSGCGQNGSTSNAGASLQAGAAVVPGAAGAHAESTPAHSHAANRLNGRERVHGSRTPVIIPALRGDVNSRVPTRSRRMRTGPLAARRRARKRLHDHVVGHLREVVEELPHGVEALGRV